MPLKASDLPAEGPLAWALQGRETDHPLPPPEVTIRPKISTQGGSLVN